MLSVANKPIMLSVNMLNVVMLSVVSQVMRGGGIHKMPLKQDFLKFWVALITKW
jgi:hypothetical protein